MKTTAKYICTLCDCVSIGNKGDQLVLDVFNAYPYANCYLSRTATRKSIPGTLQIKGDGKSNRFVANLFVQFYPGTARYPNDNGGKRAEWFQKCLEELQEISNAESFAFPSNMPPKFIELVDDFCKKYYLKHKQSLTITDYDGCLLETKTETKTQVRYQAPIKSIQIARNFLEDVEDDPEEPDGEAEGDAGGDSCDSAGESDGTKGEKGIIPSQVTRHIDIRKLQFICLPEIASQSKITIREKQVPVSTPVPAQPQLPAPTHALAPAKIKLGVKTKVPAPPLAPPLAPPQSPAPAPKDSQSEKKYDKNPFWKGSLLALMKDVHLSWHPILQDSSMASICCDLEKDFLQEMDNFGDHLEILPAPDHIFNAFKLCQFPPKCVILGQDPYFSNLNEAMGLSFSVPSNVEYPPTLNNIFKELSTDIPDFKVPKSGDLTSWANQGVLLLNTALTVRYRQKESHLKIWQKFTNQIVKLISQKTTTPVVYMLWGAHAKARKSMIDAKSNVLILEATHPSPLGANQGGWFGSGHFSKCNQFLGSEGINWHLEK